MTRTAVNDNADGDNDVDGDALDVADNSIHGDDDNVSCVGLSFHLLSKSCAPQASQIRVLRSNPVLIRPPRIPGPQNCQGAEKHPWCALGL